MPLVRHQCPPPTMAVVGGLRPTTRGGGSRDPGTTSGSKQGEGFQSWVFTSPCLPPFLSLVLSVDNTLPGDGGSTHRDMRRLGLWCRVAEEHRNRPFWSLWETTTSDFPPVSQIKQKPP